MGNSFVTLQGPPVQTPFLDTQKAYPSFPWMKWFQTVQQAIIGTAIVPSQELGAQINAIINSFPPSGGVIDVPAGDYKVTTPIIINKPVIINFGAGTLTLNIPGTAVTISASTKIQGVGGSGGIETLFQYQGTGIAFRVFNPSSLVFNLALIGIQIAATAGTVSARGLSLEGLSQFYCRDISVGSSSAPALAGFTDGIYFSNTSIGYFDGLTETNNGNALHFDSSTGGPNASIDFSHLNIFNNTNVILMNSGLNLKFRDSWTEWANCLLFIDNNGSVGGADIEDISFDDVRFINGPGSPFQSSQTINIQASNNAAIISLRSIEFKGCQLLQQAAKTSSVLANSVRIAVSGASLVACDSPIKFVNSYVSGGSGAAISCDSVNVRVLTIDSVFAKDGSIGAPSSSTFSGSGAFMEMDLNPSGSEQFSGGLVIGGVVSLNGGLSVNSLNCQMERIHWAGKPVTAANFALSAGWGTGSAVSIGEPSVDSSGAVSIQSGSAAITANPTVTFTFADGSGISDVIVLAVRGDAIVDTASWRQTGFSPTSATFTFVGTPAPLTNYVLIWHSDFH